MGSGKRGSRLEFIPIQVQPKRDRFDLARTVLRAIAQNGAQLRDGDILVISSKFAAMAEGRAVNLAEVSPSQRAKRLAAQLQMSSKLAELVLQEAEAIFLGVPGFALAVKHGVIAPNAGIDKSNIYPGWAIPYPHDPFGCAEQVRSEVLRLARKRIGVVLADSRLMPTRIGTTGVAVAVAGFEPVADERGRKDLFGNVLRVTRRALADDISAGAQLLMGEADEAIPIVIVRNAGVRPTERRITSMDLAVPFEECIYVRGLSGGRPQFLKAGSLRPTSLGTA